MINLIKMLFGKKNVLTPGQVVNLAIVKGYYDLENDFAFMCYSVANLYYNGFITKKERIETTKTIHRAIERRGTLRLYLMKKKIPINPKTRSKFWNDFIANHS